MKLIRLLTFVTLSTLVLFTLIACDSSKKEKITQLSQLDGKEFGVPTGTVADSLVLSKLSQAKFQYYNSILDAAIAVKQGKIDAAAYDEPVLKNIAGKNPGLIVLPDMITHDDYGFAVRLDDAPLKQAIDSVVQDMKANGEYETMIKRWLPEEGAPNAMPAIAAGSEGALRFGTSAITEPFSFVDGSQKVVGIDIELAALVAKKLNKKLEVVNMEFGSMIPALAAGKVDMIGACITITEDRSKKVLFSAPYYRGGIAAIVKQ